MSTPATIGRQELLAELQRELGHLLGAERRLRGRDQQRDESDLSHAQVRALFVLGRSEETTAGELARVAGLSSASTTAMLDDLERRGIVVRRRSEADRRRVLVSLTDEGRRVLARRRRRWAASWNHALAEIPEDELAGAARVLRTIAELFDAV